MGDYKVLSGSSGTISGDLGVLFVDETTNYVTNVMGANGATGIKDMYIAGADSSGNINIGWDAPSDQDTEAAVDNLTIIDNAVFSPEAGQMNVKETFNFQGGFLHPSSLKLSAGGEPGWVRVKCDASTNTHLGAAHTSGNATYECWIRPAADADMCPFMKSTEFAVRIDPGTKVLFCTGQDFNWRNMTDSSGANYAGIAVNKWSHIAITAEPTTVDGADRAIWTLYHNGRAAATYITTTGGSTWSSDNSEYVFIGKYDDDAGDTTQGDNHWNGAIQNFRIWSDKRTPSEIRAGMFLTYADGTANLVEQWTFKEGYGTSVAGTNLDAGNYEAGIMKKWNGSAVVTSGSTDSWSISSSAASGSSSDFIYSTSTLKMTGATSIIYHPHSQGVYNLNCSPSGGDTDIRAQFGGGDLHVYGTFTGNGGTFQNSTPSAQRLDLHSTPVWGNTSMSGTSVLPSGSGPVYLPYLTGTTAQTYSSLSVRCSDTILSGDAIVSNTFDTDSGTKKLRTNGYNLTLSGTKNALHSSGTLQVDGGTVLTMGSIHGFSGGSDPPNTGTLDIRGENAAAFPSHSNNTLTRASLGGTPLDFGVGDFSISFWHKSNDDWTREHQILGSGNFYLHLNNAGGSAEKVNVYVGNVYRAIVFDSKRLSTNWNHIVVTFDRSDLMKVYVNGSYEGNVSIAGESGQDIINTGNLAIGEANATAGRGWNGYLADVRFYKGILLTDGGVSVGSTATGNIATLYNSGLNPATHVNTDGTPHYSDSGNSLGATTWYKLGPLTADSGARTTVPTLDLQDYDGVTGDFGLRSGGLTLTNTGGVKPGFGLLTNSQTSIEDDFIAGILKFRNMKVCSNVSSGPETISPLDGSVFSGKVVLD